MAFVVVITQNVKKFKVMNTFLEHCVLITHTLCFW